LTVAAGQRMPVHASAAGKLLLAYLSDDTIDFWLSRPLPAYTTRTLCSAKQLRAEIASIKRRGWADDKGETAPSILAYGAPVIAGNGQAVAVVSVPFLAGTSAAQMDKIKSATVRTARAMSTAIAD